MNYNQNEKILQLTDKTLIIGVDIAKHTHVARAQDFRGVQFGKPLYIENSFEGFQMFTRWMNDLTAQNEKTEMKINTLMDQYTLLHKKINEIWEMIEGLTSTIPGVKEMTDIKGIGDITIAAFLAEVGNLNNYEHPEQIIKLAGLNLRLATSGKWKGQTVITKRGRPKLGALWFQVILPLVNQ